MMATVGMNRELKLYARRVMVLLGVVLLVGCNSGSNAWPVAHLQGQVTINGEPIPGDAEGRIMFIPPATGANRNARPAIVPIVGGRYDAPDVPIGPLTVRFDITRYTGEEVQLEGNRGKVRVSESLVPKDVREGIAVEVAEGDQTRDFDL